VRKSGLLDRGILIVVLGNREIGILGWLHLNSWKCVCLDDSRFLAPIVGHPIAFADP
jgi:hypothetical protein